jgi:hypothetical protein
MKKCNKCELEKDYSDFNVRRASKDGYSYICKSCKYLVDKEYSLKNKESIKNYRKKYYQENKDNIKSKSNNHYQENKEVISNYYKNYYQENKDNIKSKSNNYYQENKDNVLEKIKNKQSNEDYRELNKEKSKKWRDENPKKVKENNKKYRESNKDKIKEYRLYYYSKNKNKINEYMRDYYKDRKYIKSWRQLLFRYCKFFNVEKKSNTNNLLGFSPLQLKGRIECQFKEGMSWDNYGLWEIDHKKPLSKFSKDTKPSIVNALCNLQPLWKEDNRKKSNKWK